MRTKSKDPHPDQGRLPSLDGLRGLAAVSVATQHGLMVFPVFWAAANFGPTKGPVVDVLTYSPLHLLWAGHEAVLLFFVLSGFVLALPFVDGKGVLYGAFVIRRIWRVYVPYVGASAAAAVVALTVSASGLPSLSQYVNNQWTRTPIIEDLLNLVLMRGDSGDMFNSPSWSLIYEVRISLLVPALALVARRWPWPAAMTTGTVLVFAGAALADAVPWSLDFLRTVEYTGLFLVGATLARHRAGLRSRWAVLPGLTRLLIVVMAIGLYLGQWLPNRGFGLPTDLLIACGATLLLCIALFEHHVERLLVSRLCRYLGRVSFSLYLCHLPVLLFLLYTLGRVTSPLVAVGVFPLAALASAELVHRALEDPARRAGSTLARRLTHRPRLQPVSVSPAMAGEEPIPAGR